MPNLDIRSLSFIAMVSSLLLAVGLQFANRIITRDQSLRLWAMGATANGGGYILLALRGIVPDLFSIVLGNTLLIVGSVWLYQGNRTFRGRKDEFPWYWLLTVVSVVLLAYFTFLSPNLNARIITLSAAAAAMLFPSTLVLLRPGDRDDRLLLGFVATPFFATAVFMSLRAAITLASSASEQDFMAQTSAIQSFSLIFGIGLNSLLGIGLPLLVSGRIQHLQLELERSVDEHTHALEKANDDLAGREGLLSQILDTSSVAIFLLDEGGRIRKANQRMAEMFGYAIDELVGKEYVDLVHPAQREVGRQKMFALLGSAITSVDLDRQYWRSDHGEFWGHLAGRRFYEAKGDAHGLIGVITDITERKNAEERLLQKNLSLNAIIENFPGGISLFDAELRLAAYNEQFKKLLDFPDSLFEKSNLCFEDVIRYNAKRGEYGPGDPEQQVAAIVERARHVQPHRMERVRPSGLVLDIQGMPLPGGGFVTIYIDVTERKRNESVLADAKLAAETANRAKSAFLATMSHEIRTPMNGILGMAQLLLMPELTEDERQDYARTILTSGQTLLTLLNDILDLSKIEAGKFQLEANVFDPTQLLRETHTLFFGTAKAKKLQFEQHWRGPIGQRYQADSHRLRQMLSNLVGNALKFTRQGEVSIEGTELSREGASAILEFSVRDTGIGIPSEKLDLLFKPFSQTDSSTTREFGGSGLGLSIVRSLAQALGGDVGVSSESGVGSRFWFRVNVALVAQGEESRQSERLVATGIQPDLASRSLSGTVLVVEDNAVNRIFIKALLGKLGLKFTLAHDGQHAVDAITRGERPDVVLMDIQMPVMDGYAATERIRQWEAAGGHPRLPIIALTADAFEDDQQRCRAAGMDDFLAKPVAVDALRSALGKWLAVGQEQMSDAAPSAAQAKTLDRHRFATLIEEITPLLEQNKFAAIVRFKELRNLVAGTAIAAEIDDINKLLEAVRFDLALERLRALPSCSAWGAA